MLTNGVKASRLNLLALLLIALLAFTAYIPALENQYAYDDHPIVKDNPLVKKEASLIEIFSSPYWDAEKYPGRGLYRPLTIYSFEWSANLRQSGPAFDHLINILLHALIGGLLFLFILKFTHHLPTSLLLSLLYTLHPVHTEVVASLVGRGDLFAGLFALTALYTLTTGLRFSWQLIAFNLLYLAGLFSKESVVALIGIAPLLLLMRNSWQKDQLKKITYILLSGLITFALYMLARHLALDGFDIDHSQTNYMGDNIFERFAMALGFTSLFLQKLIQPLPLLPDYTYYVAYGTMDWFVRTVVVVIFISFIIRICWHVVKERKLTLWQFGFLSFFLCILPVSNLLFIIGTPFAERLLYLPALFVPFCLLAPPLCKTLASRKLVLNRVAMVAALLLAPMLMGITHVRAPFWRDNLTLFTAGFQDRPNNYHIRLAYATVLKEVGANEQAKQHFVAAAKMRPDTSEPLMELGYIAYEEKDYQTAKKYYTAAKSRIAKHHRHLAHFNLALAYRGLGDFDLALKELGGALKLKPNYVDAYIQQGRTKLLVNRPQEAVEDFLRAVQLDAKSYVAWRQLIATHLKLGNRQTVKTLLAKADKQVVNPKLKLLLQNSKISLKE